MIDIHPVTAQDRDGWLRLRRELWPGGAATHAAEVDRFLAGRAEHPHAVLVAADGDRVVGFAELAVRLFAEGCGSDGVGYLEGWYVDGDHRRRGVGRALVEAGERWAREQGCTEFASDTLVGNRAGVRAHLACGFEEAAMVQCFRKSLREPDLGPGGE